MRMRRTPALRILLAGAALASALALAGCAAGGASTVDQAPVPQQPQPFTGQESAGQESDGQDATLGSGTTAVDRSVIETANLTITAADPVDAADEAERIVEAAGGRIDARSEAAPTDGDAGSASLTLRVPADRLSAVLDDLRGLGRADELSRNRSDVTVEVQDLDARISALRASTARLEALMAQATGIDDIVALEAQLSDRQGQLESLEAQQRALADQVSMSTISLWLRSDAQAPPTEPGSFVDGLVTGWNAFVAFFAGLLVALGVLLPWIVLAAAITAVILLVVRRRRSRRQGTTG